MNGSCSKAPIIPDLNAIDLILSISVKHYLKESNIMETNILCTVFLIV